MISSVRYNRPKSTTAHLNNHLYYCLLLLTNTEVRGFRSLFGKPVNGQSTTSNARTCKTNQSALYRYKYQVLSKYNPKLTQPIFIAEYVNLFWQQQWVFEWVSSYNQLKKLPVYLRNSNFIDISSMNRFLVYHQYHNPFKGSSNQKRKKIIPKNKYSTGLQFGFSIKFAKQLSNIT